MFLNILEEKCTSWNRIHEQQKWVGNSGNTCKMVSVFPGIYIPPKWPVLLIEDGHSSHITMEIIFSPHHSCLFLKGLP